MLKIMNDFSSIDRLIEFGLSIAVAQQMMNTVNTCIHQMTIPGTGKCRTNTCKSRNTGRFFVCISIPL